MTDLKWIEEEIERYKIIKNGIITILKEPHHEESFKSFLINGLIECENTLIFLYHFKSELEELEAKND